MSYVMFCLVIIIFCRLPRAFMCNIGESRSCQRGVTRRPDAHNVIPMGTDYIY